MSLDILQFSPVMDLQVPIISIYMFIPENLPSMAVLYFKVFTNNRCY